jgi:hypothetical protein
LVGPVTAPVPKVEKSDKVEKKRIFVQYTVKY